MVQINISDHVVPIILVLVAVLVIMSALVLFRGGVSDYFVQEGDEANSKVGCALGDPQSSEECLEESSNQGKFDSGVVNVSHRLA